MEDKLKPKFRLQLKHFIFCGVVIGVGALTFFVLSAFGVLRYWQTEKQSQGETNLRLEEVDLPFTHEADLDNSLPFMASAAIDIDGDGIDELFLGGGDRQADGFLAFRNGKFEPLNITLTKDPVDASLGAATMDVDNDGDTDLLVARESGVWYHENQDGTFGSVNLNLPLAENTTPLSIGLADINQDGLVDMYVAGYISIDLIEGETNFDKSYGGYSYLFLNGGNGQWIDISKSAGVFRKHNTFIGLFADLDNDRDSDLIIAQDTGVVEMYANNGDMTFTPIPNPSVYSYPMGVAAGDYDNDGLIDVYLSNVGYTIPPPVLRGNLDDEDPFNPNYMLYHNDGGLKFSDTAKAMNAARYGFGWGTVFADMNLDGKEDLLIAQNYARFPAKKLMIKYPGKILQNYGDKFMPVEKAAGMKNKNYAISPIVSDFNQDGWPDLVWANLDGKAKAFISKGGENNWIKVRLPNTARSINARVIVSSATGQTQTKQLITSQGMSSDQGRDLIFGFEPNDTAVNIQIEFQDGSVKTFDSPEMSTTITVEAP